MRICHVIRNSSSCKSRRRVGGQNIRSSYIIQHPWTMRTRPIHLLLLRHGLRYPVTARALPGTGRIAAAAATAPLTPRLPLAHAAAFHAAARRHEENRSAPPQSPWRVFVDTLTAELKKNRELAEDVKQLQGDVDKLADAKAIKAAKDLYLRTRVRRGVAAGPKVQHLT